MTTEPCRLDGRVAVAAGAAGGIGLAPAVAGYVNGAVPPVDGGRLAR